MVKINIGDIFGRLTIEKEVPKDERPQQNGRWYVCRCECGNTKIVYAGNLRSGNTKSCGCLSRETASKNNSVDIPVGTVFGNLTVLGRAPVHEGGNAYWICQCACGNVCEVSGRNLRNGQTTSCGCAKLKDTIDETNNIYGHLKVLKYAGAKEGGGALWVCECDCGNIITVRGDALRSGHTISCGCIKSKKEEEIIKLLKQYNIQFTTQYTFADLQTSYGGTPRFDFAIFKDDALYCVIEYQGAQHYDTTNQWYTEEYHARDILKQNYCKEHNIQLLIWDKTTELEKSVKELL